MSATHLAAHVEDGFNRRLIAFLRARRWHPRTIGYAGYGTGDFVRVLARVVLTRGQDEETATGVDGLTPAGAPEDQRGWRSYVTAPVGMAPVAVTIDGVTHHTRADRGGYVDLVISDHHLAPGWHDVQIQAKAARPAVARVRIVDPDTPLALLSDIDDTVMVTALPRPLLAVWNTFVRHGSARTVVPGMAPLFRQILDLEPDVPMFYLSTGAWNVVPPVRHFLRRHGYPPGPMLMTDWGPTNTGWFRSGQEHKRQTLRRLAQEFPRTRWVLIGDDGQHDPSIYREFADEFPGRVAAIGIRQLTPGEQVLAHGTTTTTADTQRSVPAMDVPEIAGGDGEQIGPELLRVLGQPTDAPNARPSR